MEDRPTAVELLDAVAELLDAAVLPAVSGPLQHQVRVAANLCRIVQRELRDGPASAARERQALAAQLGVDGTLAELNALAADRLRAAQDDDELARWWPVLHAAVLDKLAVDKPGYEILRPA